MAKELSISKAIADVFDKLVEDPQRLTKVGEVPTFEVTEIVSVNPFPETISSDFLKGKHNLIIAGQGIGTRKDEKFCVSLIAESAKSAMKAAGLRLKESGNGYTLPACTFSAAKYQMTFKAI